MRIAFDVAIGLLSGVGPCALARGASLVSIADGSSRARSAGVFVSYAVGAASAYAAYGLIAGFVLRIASWTTWMYLGLAIALFWSGLRTLAGSDAGHAHRRAAGSFGSAALLGFGGSIALSPCCTPFVFAIVASAMGDARAAAIGLTAFLCGHLTPAVLLSGLSGALSRGSSRARGWVAYATGTATLGLAVYYGVLA